MKKEKEEKEEKEEKKRVELKSYICKVQANGVDADLCRA